MKLLYCEACGDIIAPYRVANKPRWCACERHAIWWVNPYAGEVRLFDREAPLGWIEQHRYPRRPMAYLLGITNLLLNDPNQGMSAERVQAMIDAHDDYYLFKRYRSLIVRIRPGEADSTAWAAALPEGVSPDA